MKANTAKTAPAAPGPKSNWYQEWHDTDHHKTVHWMIFISIAVLCGVLLLTQINNWVSTASDLNRVIHLPTATATLSIEPTTKSIQLGQTFSADIILDTKAGPVDGVDLYALHYDPTILTIIDDEPSKAGIQIKPGVIIPYNAANTVDKTTGTIKFGQLSAGGTSFTGRGTLATIHFKATGVGTSYLKFDFHKGSTVDTNAAYRGKDQLANVVDAIYTVTAK